VQERQPFQFNGKRVALIIAGTLISLFLIVVVLGPGCRTYNRWQKREDAANQVKVTRIEIQKAEEEAKVNKAQIKTTEAEAEKRVAESVGIKKAQVEINKTLTPLYVQHEYVQAVEKGHVETTFIPVGPNGIPFVRPTP
jgi:uncharacterized protein HemX